ncbi:MAG: hypothetical protein AMR96_02625 [Candidatus Adiutrix intracellularis]|nr:MAG: hypothetical protein AMR96_02625 [Candidatus Adiutrix intracellularis]
MVPLLTNKSKCETIVLIDTFITSSVCFATFILSSILEKTFKLRLYKEILPKNFSTHEKFLIDPATTYWRRLQINLKFILTQ